MSHPEQYTIEEAAFEAECSSAWIRRAIRLSLLKSHLEPISPDSSSKRHMIRHDDLVAFLDRDGKRTPRREDKRPKWVFYATDEEVKQIKNLLISSNEVSMQVVASTIQRNTKKELP